MSDVKTGYLLVAGFRSYDVESPFYRALRPTVLRRSFDDDGAYWNVFIEQNPIEFAGAPCDACLESRLRKEADGRGAFLWWIKPEMDIRCHLTAFNMARALSMHLLGYKRDAVLPLTNSEKGIIFKKGYDLLVGKNRNYKSMSFERVLSQYWPPPAHAREFAKVRKRKLDYGGPDAMVRCMHLVI